MKFSKSVWTAAVAAVGAGVALFFTACEVDSASTVNRDVQINFSGIYRGSNGGQIPSKQTGAPVTQFDLRQSGDRLELVDNNGILWKGSIGNSPDSSNPDASFTVGGRTTAGQDVTISGNLRKDGASATIASMSGTWIEPGFYATVQAFANVASTPTNNPINTNTNSITTNANGTINFGYIDTPKCRQELAASRERLWFLPHC